METREALIELFKWLAIVNGLVGIGIIVGIVRCKQIYHKEFDFYKKYRHTIKD